MVPLSSFVNVRTTTGPEFTVRFNLYRAAEITGTPAPGYSSGQALAALEEVADADAAARDGLRVERALVPGEGRVAAAPRACSGSRCVFVFLILAALYESWSLPFSVLLSTPVAVLGAFLGPARRASSTTTSTRRSAW